MKYQNPYKDFTDRLKLLIGKNPNLITTTLGNIFTMRLVGNKTHGDLAEIAIAEFIKRFSCNCFPTPSSPRKSAMNPHLQKSDKTFPD